MEAKTLADITLPSDKYTWYQTNDATDEVTNLEVLLENGDAYWLGFENDANCKSDLQEVIFTIKDKATTPTLASQTFCELEAKTLADITLPSDKYTWYQTNDVTDEVANLDVLLENGDAYWLGFENDDNCKSELQEVIFTIKDKAATPTLASQTFCELEAKDVSRYLHYHQINTLGIKLMM